MSEYRLAERTPDDKAIRDPKCRRLLAFRRPRSNGSTAIMVEPEWDLIAGVYERNWPRSENSGGRRHNRLNRLLHEIRWFGFDEPTLMLCGCGDVLEIDFEALDGPRSD